ncbi:hypothetical protein [Arthrobacter sp. NPDC056493]|uniref:hypothetical protein n=1 Tax=Arthrobacter sp. NPDC056493 TaxID=3345839 RepID=UPI003670D8AA
MANEIGKKHRSAPRSDSSLERRGLLRVGTLITAFTGASAISAVGATGAQAVPVDATIFDAYVPLAEKGAASGVAALDPEAKVPFSQLPDLSSLYGPDNGGKPVGKDELIVNVRDHGVKGDAVKKSSGGGISAGSAAFTGAGFTAADVGKAFYAVGAGTAAATLSTAIAAYVSPTEITLAAPAVTTVADAAYMYGTDDTAAIQALLNSVSNKTHNAFLFPRGSYITAGLHLKSNTRLIGAGRGGWAYEFYERSTRLIARPGVTTAGLINDYKGTVGGNVYIADMMLDGAKQYHAKPCTGIYLMDSTTSADSLWNLERVMVKDFSGDGTYFGAWRRANRVNECHFVGNAGHGSVYAGTDNSAIQSMWAMNGGNGLEMLQGANHFYGADIFNNTGHGVRIVPLGRMNHFVSCFFDTNKKCGVYTEAKNTSLVQCRWTSNSQEADGVYPDVDIVAGPSGVTLINPTFYAAVPALANLPHSGIRATGNTGSNLVYVVGFSHDPGTITWRRGSYVETTVGLLHKGFSFADGTILQTGSSTGTRLGGAATQKLAFWGARPITRPTVTGSRGGNAAVTALLTQLANMGLITNNTTV